MEELELLIKLLSSVGYGSAATVLVIILLIYNIYNKIKYRCLERISLYVAQVEANTDMNGEAKFQLVVDLINTEMKITRNQILTGYIRKLIQEVYDSNESFAKNYMVKQFGKDGEKLLNKLEKRKSEE